MNSQMIVELALTSEATAVALAALKPIERMDILHVVVDTECIDVNVTDLALYIAVLVRLHMTLQIALG
jgi:hypothetical protein